MPDYSTYHCLRVQLDRGIARVTLDNGAINLLDKPLFKELLRLTDQLAADDRVRVVLVDKVELPAVLQLQRQISLTRGGFRPVLLADVLHTDNEIRTHLTGFLRLGDHTLGVVAGFFFAVVDLPGKLCIEPVERERRCHDRDLGPVSLNNEGLVLLTFRTV